jgi:ATP-binding cassette subfamily C exporter for protease/lipase
MSMNKSFSFLDQQLKPYRKTIWLIFGIGGLLNLLMLTPTIYMLQVFDRVMVSQNMLTLAVISTIVILMYLFLGVFQWLRTRVLIAISIKFDQELSKRVFSAVISSELHGGSVPPQQALGDLASVRQWITGDGAYSFLDAPWSLIFLVVMFLLHPVLGFTAIVFMIILVIYTKITTVVTEDSAELADNEERELNRFVYNRLRNAEVVEAHGMLGAFRQEWWKRQVELMSLSNVANDLQSRMGVGGREIRLLMNSLSLGVGAYLAIKGEITFGAMIAAALLMSRATSPVEAIASGWKSFLAARKSLERLADLLEKQTDTPSDVASGALDGQIRVESLSVKVDQRIILENISCVFEPGKAYVLVGGSGAGKSTLMKTLLGVMPKAQGVVEYGGVPSGQFYAAVHGQQIGYIPQEVDLFEGTIAENIARMGEVDSEKVIRAAQRIGIHPFILGLPSGYDTMLGDRATVLSGGQRQQIALARALYGDPKIVFMDEPDASLDVKGVLTLERVMRAMHAEGITVIVISHRAKSLELADEVIHIERGQIVFKGPVPAYRSQLYAKRGNVALGAPHSPEDDFGDAETVPV